MAFWKSRKFILGKKGRIGTRARSDGDRENGGLWEDVRVLQNHDDMAVWGHGILLMCMFRFWEWFLVGCEGEGWDDRCVFTVCLAKGLPDCTVAFSDGAFSRPFLQLLPILFLCHYRYFCTVSCLFPVHFLTIGAYLTTRALTIQGM